MDRRTALARLSSVVAASASWPKLIAKSRAEHPGRRTARAVRARVRKIATEEAFVIPEVAAALREVAQKGGPSLDLKLMNLIYNSASASTFEIQTPTTPPPTNRDAYARTLLPRLLDLEEHRLAEMDANGVDVHLLSLTTPGVQMFEREKAIELATLANDRLSEVVRRHPKRFAGLASFAPQDAAAAAKEMERAIKTLRLNGFIVNSHTDNRYLDDQRFWPILEAAEALDAPLYIHPRPPSDGMAAPFADYRMEGAIWGYGVETGTHAVRLMLSGVLDQFPKIRIVIGHMGEALPYWLWRLDYMASPGSRAALRNKLKPSEYLQRNFAITTSGLDDPLALRYAIDKIGIDHVMWAIDYPFQSTPGSVAFIENASLSDTEREQVAYRNAERIFRIS